MQPEGPLAQRVVDSERRLGKVGAARGPRCNPATPTSPQTLVLIYHNYLDLL